MHSGACTRVQNYCFRKVSWYIVGLIHGFCCSGEVGLYTVGLIHEFRIVVLVIW